eukprot:5842012-Prymnesium_polylepis.4
MRLQRKNAVPFGGAPRRWGAGRQRSGWVGSCSCSRVVTGDYRRAMRGTSCVRARLRMGLLVRALSLQLRQLRQVDEEVEHRETAVGDGRMQRQEACLNAGVPLRVQVDDTVEG